VWEKGGGGRNGRSGSEHSLVYDVQFAIKAFLAAAKVMGGSLTAGITSTEEEGQRPEGIGKEGRALVMLMIIIMVAMELQGDSSAGERRFSLSDLA
jgi:hypothetical protein